MDETIYEPREDSFLLQRYVEEFCRPNFTVLDMGTGSGIQALAAAKNAKEVLAADINPAAVKHVKEEIRFKKIKNIKAVESDLFSKIPMKQYDLIVFNPPYLPEEEYVNDLALVSARRGTEATTRFIEAAGEYLAKEGVILITGSSLAKKALIDESIKKSLFESEILETMHVFFEDIFVMKIVKSPLSKKLLEDGIYSPKLFAKGKRGVIIKGRYKKTEIAVKIKKDSSTAQGTIRNEINFLRILNKKGIGPELISGKDDYLMYKFVEGDFIFDFVKANGKKKIIDVIVKVYGQLFTMDSLGINKFEMHHPVKHIIVQKNHEPVLIDFERARNTKDPKNVSQFCDFLIGEDINNLLMEKGIIIDRQKMICLAREYKGNICKKNYNNIVSYLKASL